MDIKVSLFKASAIYMFEETSSCHGATKTWV
jgi:hypothetical protein